MEDKKLLIVGIDPGITTAYSILDFNGGLIRLESSKDLGINSLIYNVMKEGKVILVGTDKAKVPSLVYNLATKLGAKLIHPREDLKVSEKRLLVSRFKTKDEHQGDALAASLFAFNSVKNMTKRVDSFLNENKKSKIKNQVLELVLLNGLSLRNSIDIIENPERKEVKIIKESVKEKSLNRHDYIKLYNKLKGYEREILFLKKQNINLKNNIKNVENYYGRLMKKTNKANFAEETEKLIGYKEKRIQSFDKELKLKNDELSLLKENIKKLNYFLANINNFYLLKKLKNLGSLEFNQKNRLLNINEGNILLVEDPNIISQDVIEKLKDKVNIILYKKTISEKIRNRLKFTFINCKNLSVFETEHFAFIEKELIDNEIGKINLLNKVITDYRKEHLQISEIQP